MRPVRLWMLGVSHRHAGAALRERIALQGEALTSALHAQGQGSLAALASERIILSTCTRTEIYVILHPSADDDPDTNAPGDSLLRDWLCAISGLPHGALDVASEAREGRDVVRHLLRVSSGLDSAVLGEPQVLAQTTHALEAAHAAAASGPILTRLFQEAIRTGKQVRSSTGVARNRLSTAHAGLDLAERALGGSGSLHGKRVALLGAGEIAGIAARILRNRAADTIIINRSTERGARLAADVAAQAYGLDALRSELAQADLLVAAIQAPTPLVTPALLGERVRPLVIVDLSLPRAVDPAVDLHADVRRFDVDDLEAAASSLREAYAHDLAAAGTIIDAATERCWCWLQERPAAPAIDALRRHAATVRDAQLARILPRLGHLSERDREQVLALANGIVNGLLHDPAVNLRSAARDGSIDSARSTLDSLYGLNDDPHAHNAAPATVPTSDAVLVPEAQDAALVDAALHATSTVTDAAATAGTQALASPTPVEPTSTHATHAAQPTIDAAPGEVQVQARTLPSATASTALPSLHLPRPTTTSEAERPIALFALPQALSPTRPTALPTVAAAAAVAAAAMASLHTGAAISNDR